MYKFAIVIYILMRDGGPFPAFPVRLHLQIHMPMSSYLAASAKSAVTLFRQIVTLRGITLPISYNVYGPFGEHLRRPTIAHERQNDVRRLLLAELGLRKPPSGNPEGIGLLGEEGCTFPLPLWSSNRRESGRTEIVYSAYIREGKGIYGRERASILLPSRGGRLQISPPL